MNSRELARFDALKGAICFGINNVNDFKPTSGTTKMKSQELFDALGVVTDGEAGTGDFRSGTTSKSVQRDGLMAVLRAFNKSAAAVASADNTPEIMDNFRMPHGTNDTIIAARARAFADAAVPLKAKFLALEHPADFIEALRQRVVDFENASSDQNTGLQDQVGATASNIQRPSANGKPGAEVKPSPNAKQPAAVPPPTPASARQAVLTT